MRFMLDTRRAALAIEKAFHPSKLNFGAYSDTLAHPHWHLVPKYEGGPEWGGRDLGKRRRMSNFAGYGK